MHVISIDIETFSDIDLGKCGVYRYAESPSFDILLFSYSMDDGQIKLIDLASGEKLPGTTTFVLFVFLLMIKSS
jgi:DNA polymerase